MTAAQNGDATPSAAPGPDRDQGGRALALRVHAQLRGMLLSGQLAEGSVLLQAQLARELGVSRTPMREAFRLLQEEGLIDTAPDQRARVRSVDATDLDATYGTRILLETLGVSMTMRGVTERDVDDMWEALGFMRQLAKAESAKWYQAHRDFHRLTTAAAPPQLARQIASLSEQCDRYIRLDRLGHRGAPERADAEHEALVAAFRSRDEPTAVRTISRHLARTALGILIDLAPQTEPIATRTALRLVDAG